MLRKVVIFMKAIKKTPALDFEEQESSAFASGYGELHRLIIFVKATSFTRNNQANSAGDSCATLNILAQKLQEYP